MKPIVRIVVLGALLVLARFAVASLRRRARRTVKRSRRTVKRSMRRLRRG
ncbi:hypothetical protein [Sinomonas sp.]|jgi:hypothetical protein